MSQFEQPAIEPTGDERYETIKSYFANLYHYHPDVYDVFSKNQVVQSDLIDEISKVLKSHVLDSSATFLDVGCGTGVVIEQLAPLFPSITFIGVDPAESSLKLARERCLPYKNASFRNGIVEELEQKGEKFNVVFSSWGHIQWNAQGKIMERVATDGGVVMLVNNWGENDDFGKLWPETAISVFVKRRELMQQGDFNVQRLDSYLDLTDPPVYNSMSKLFGEEYVVKHKAAKRFQIGIVLAWKKL